MCPLLFAPPTQRTRASALAACHIMHGLFAHMLSGSSADCELRLAQVGFACPQDGSERKGEYLYLVLSGISGSANSISLLGDSSGEAGIRMQQAWVPSCLLLGCVRALLLPLKAD